ncbi:MAG TPA: glucose-1-phosphate adenylyltransferase, partial [Candidatus Hydrogenedentes bacterium]|nr:glucose-1-phosphate adenylyltransferase [Candidatus Hydrogenedentota bacterium]
VLSGDQLYRMDYRTLLATHLSKNADITVSALPVSREAAQSFGIMRVQRDGRIRSFVEKPADPAILNGLKTPDGLFKEFDIEAGGKPYLASMGIYAFRAGVLEELLLGNPEWIDFGKQLIPNTLKTHKVCAHMFSGFWEDIGTVRSYFDVSMAMTSPNPPFALHDPDHQIYTHARALPGVRIHDARIKNAIVCSGSRIHRATISDAIVGIRSIVNEGAVIERSIVLGADYFETAAPRRRHPIGIGAGSRIRQAIVDHNARIGRKVIIRGSDCLKDCEGEGYSVRDGIVVVHKDAVIPDGTVIG